MSENYCELPSSMSEAKRTIIQFRAKIDKLNNVVNLTKELCGAQRVVAEEEVEDWLTGGNGQFDDAFYAGQDSGASDLAQRVLAIMNEEVNDERKNG